MKQVGFYMVTMAFLLLMGCDDQRDLYSFTSPVLKVECNWVPSLNKENMQEATVLFYKDGSVAAKEYFSNPANTMARVTRGEYSLLAFNGIMESENVTNLDFLYFCNTSLPETFEACSAEGVTLKRLVRSDDEYIASNDMELLARAYCNVTVEGSQSYYVKYENGKNTNTTILDHVECVAQLTPKAVSFRFKVRLNNVVNASSSRSASAALRGFVGSIFLFTDNGIPNPGFYATHHLNFSSSTNRKLQTNALGEEVGNILSEQFVTFGPPMPKSLDQLPTSGQYSLDLSFLLTDNKEFTPVCCPIDITPQVNEAIHRIFRHHSGVENIDNTLNLFTIEINDPVTLPVIMPENMVEVEEWEDDEEIMVWIK